MKSKFSKRPITFKMDLLLSNLDGKDSFIVSLRELHIKLENRDEFAHWIKNRIERYDFVEGKDFIVFGELPNNLKGGRPRIEYIGTIAMAKELAMVENNEMGKRARRYFLHCEERVIKMDHLDLGIKRMPTLPISSLGFEQMSLEDRKQQKNQFHQIFKAFHLTKGKNSHHRIRMCAGVNLILNGMSSYFFRNTTGVTGKTRDWLPLANQYALYRTEYDTLEACVRNEFDYTFEELEEVFLTFARATKSVVEMQFRINLHDELLNRVEFILAEARRQLEDDKISPYQLTEDMVFKMMEERAILLDELKEQTSNT